MKNPGHHLIAGFKEGNRDAFRLVYQLHHRALYNFVRQLTDDRHEAEDIVADTFVKLWNLKANFETDNNIKAFLYITARNASLNFLRYQKRLNENRRELFYLHDEEDQPEFEVPTYLQLLELIQQTLDKLPNRQRQIMQMILFEGLNDEEVAERLNKNPKTIRNLKNIALNYLRLNLDKKEFVSAMLIISLSHI